METRFKLSDSVGVVRQRADGTLIVPSRFRRRGIKVAASVVAAASMFFGTFDVKCVTAEGKLRWEQHVKNGVTGQGLNKILNCFFHLDTLPTGWYLDLTATGATYAFSDVYATHAGWSYTTSTNYTQATRPQWSPASSTAQSSTNASTVDFTMNATCTINGIAVVTGSTTKADSAAGGGVLWATGAFPGGEQAVVATDSLKITYTVNASAS
jgi:hypothetical protein